MKLLITKYNPPLNKEMRYTVTTSRMGAIAISSAFMSDVLTTQVDIVTLVNGNACHWLTLWTRDILVSPDKVEDKGLTAHPQLDQIWSKIANSSSKTVPLQEFISGENSTYPEPSKKVDPLAIEWEPFPSKPEVPVRSMWDRLFKDSMF